MGSFHTLAVGVPEIFWTELGDPIDPNSNQNSNTGMGCSQHVTSLECQTHIESNGVETKYSFEYATVGGSYGPFSSGGSGSISVAEDFGQPKAQAAGLTPETVYDVRVTASNANGLASETQSLETRPAKPSSPTAHVLNVTATSAHLEGQVIPDDFETEYRFEYATAEGGPWVEVPGGSGTIPAAEASEEFEDFSAHLTGLAPNTAYYVRLFAKNSHGEATSSFSGFRTAGPPTATTFAVHALDGEGVRVLGSVGPGGVTSSEEQTVTVGGGATGGTFTLTFEGQATGATGTGDLKSGSVEVEPYPTTTSGAFIEGEAISGPGIPADTTITHVFTPEKKAEEEKEAEEGIAEHPETKLQSEGILANLSHESTSLTLSHPAAVTASGVALSAEIPFSPKETAGEHNEEDTLQRALEALPSIGKGNVSVSGGEVAGSYTVEFSGAALTGRDLPQMIANATGLTPSGTATVATVQSGAPFDSHDRFQYTTGGFAGCGTPANPACLTSPEVDSGAGEVQEEQVNGHPFEVLGGSRVVGQDLPGLQPGATYHYRIVASNSTPGNPVVDGGEQAVTVPAPAQAGEEACPNAALRTGPSAQLPDCRAYEQVTPAEKEGSIDNWAYSNVGVPVVVGEDGEHVWVNAQLSKWGSNVDPTNSSYFFARTPAGWQMTSATPQPQATDNSYRPSIFSEDLTQVGLNVGWSTGGVNDSPDLEFEVGPPGGPYTLVASAPRSKPTEWVAASADFKKMILASEDHTLLGHATGTMSGEDLYEYAGGVLRQANVLSDGKEISPCGASMVSGFEGNLHEEVSSSPYAVSADGSRVFFEDDCTRELYVRVNGKTTVDVGAYRFIAGNADGSELLLERLNGETHEFFLDELGNVESGTVTPIFSTHRDVTVQVSEDFTAFYFQSVERLTPEAPLPSRKAEHAGKSPEDLYRYDIPGKSLSFIVQTSGDPLNGRTLTSPDGRYYYWGSEGVGAIAGAPATPQVFRYDSGENVVECMSCASLFDPTPKLLSTFIPEGARAGETVDSVPDATVASANGDYVFFDTPSALVPGDVDGETSPTLSRPPFACFGIRGRVMCMSGVRTALVVVCVCRVVWR